VSVALGPIPVEGVGVDAIWDDLDAEIGIHFKERAAIGFGDHHDPIESPVPLSFEPPDECAFDPPHQSIGPHGHVGLRGHVEVPGVEGSKDGGAVRELSCKEREPTRGDVHNLWIEASELLTEGLAEAKQGVGGTRR
jgi:hypothetical protein